jgi:ribonuclease HI
MKNRAHKPRFIVFCDGACIGNPGPGGWSCVIWDTEKESVQELAGHREDTTNNKMELTAAGKALRQLEGSEGVIHIFSDSKYVVDGFHKWAPGWKKNGWKKGDGSIPANIEFWKRLCEIVEHRPDPVRFFYVPGHSGNTANDRCDELAVAASKKKQISLLSLPFGKYQVQTEVDLEKSRTD